MKKPEVFDVLVVYTDGIATSASSSPLNTMPFSVSSGHREYNDSYAYLLTTCRKNNLKAGFTTTKDITKKGFFKTYWLFRRNKWIKVNSSCYSALIFDKFSPINQTQRDRRISLFSNLSIEPFNSNKILRLFFDKQETYDVLHKFAVPTVTLKNKSAKSISEALIELKGIIGKHPKKEDFSKNIVIKDRYGAGGNYIYKIGVNNTVSKIENIVAKNLRKSFVLQPFARFNKGYKYRKIGGHKDIRLIFMRNKIIQSYVRTSARGDFRCNTHQGGNVEYISKKEIPAKIIKMAKEIMNVLVDNNSVFALDFIISNSGNAYLMEGNVGPGLNWSLSLNKDEKNTKKLIREIVNEFSFRLFKRPSLFFKPNLIAPLAILPAPAE